MSKQEMKLKKCPFCLGDAKLVKTEMWQGSHGYHGEYGYHVECTNMLCSVKPKGKEYDTVYEKDCDKQIEKAIDSWNNRDKKDYRSFEQIYGQYY